MVLGAESVAGGTRLTTRHLATAQLQTTAQQQTTTQQAPPVVQNPEQVPAPIPAPAVRPSLNIVVLDPAHGGADSGARGASGINESEIVMDLTRAVRAALESKGFRVVQTRTGNEGPSFDDRSATANAQRGAVFITLHVSSTGEAGQVRVYSEPIAVAVDAAGISFPWRNGLLPWDRAQEPYAAASRRLAEMMQTSLAQKFSGSPTAPLTAPVRQLRTVALPAIAIEISSVSVSNRDQLLKMAPGIADSVADTVSGFKAVYEAWAR